MRIILGFVLAAAAGSGALSADLRSLPGARDEVLLASKVSHHTSRQVIAVRRSSCTNCPGSRLPLGGLHALYNARLPLGGLGLYCPPELETRQVVLIRKS